MQPHPAVQYLVAIAALMVSSAILLYAVTTFVETRNARGSERNAKLVEIGVSILRVDPQKEAQISAARHWALDLIDANAGGVKFSEEARAELLKRPLGYEATYYPGYDSTYRPGYDSTYVPSPRDREK
jgi:hypothetical protein